MTEALIIIDVQQGMFAFPEMQPYDSAETVARITVILNRARAAKAPVFFVQHAGENGHPLAPGTAGFPFHVSLTPLPTESVTVKRHCNAFQETELESVLRAADIESVVVTGMQSNYCVDTFVRAAKERGFAIRLVSDGHTTFDTPVLTAEQIIAHHNRTLEGSFATLVKAEDVCFSA